MESADEQQAYTGNRWYAVQTRSRHEKLSGTLVAKKGIEVYLPVKKSLRTWSDRKKWIEFPLFKGYFFVRLPFSKKDQVLQTKGVVKILGEKKPEPIPDDQIESLKSFEKYEVEVDPYPQFQPGRNVKVIHGPLQGCTGILTQKKGRYRLVVLIKVLMQAASVEIDGNDVELID
ncbi:MAG: UpxY family transcription antiterminator [Candidatus Aureabacteria bacterium]|nr:UpxY family transcription antiterminator [Candidatus Auribacterota bacterium]